MRNMKYFFLALALMGAAGASNVWAQHRHSSTHVGVVFGVPAYGPYYAAPYPYAYPYYPYPYNYPPVIAVQPTPPVYVEQGQENADTEHYWYFCNNPQGYYPYIKQCRTNWQRVTPFPQSN